MKIKYNKRKCVLAGSAVLCIAAVCAIGVVVSKPGILPWYRKE